MSDEYIEYSVVFSLKNMRVPGADEKPALNHQWIDLLQAQKFLLHSLIKLNKWKLTHLNSFVSHTMLELTISSKCIPNHSSINDPKSSIQMNIILTFHQSLLDLLDVFLILLVINQFLLKNVPISFELFLLRRPQSSYLRNYLARSIIVKRLVFLNESWFHQYLYLIITITFLTNERFPSRGIQSSFTRFFPWNFLHPFLLFLLFLLKLHLFLHSEQSADQLDLVNVMAVADQNFLDPVHHQNQASWDYFSVGTVIFLWSRLEFIQNGIFLRACRQLGLRAFRSGRLFLQRRHCQFSWAKMSEEEHNEVPILNESLFGYFMDIKRNDDPQSCQCKL